MKEYLFDFDDIAGLTNLASLIAASLPVCLILGGHARERRGKANLEALVQARRRVEEFKQRLSFLEDIGSTLQDKLEGTGTPEKLATSQRLLEEVERKLTVVEQSQNAGRMKPSRLNRAVKAHRNLFAQSSGKVAAWEAELAKLTRSIGKDLDYAAWRALCDSSDLRRGRCLTVSRTRQTADRLRDEREDAPPND
jgi:hypothetical protein